MTTHPTNITIFDCLDTIQGYKGAPLGESKGFYLEQIAAAHNIGVEEMLARVSYLEQLAWTHELLVRGDLEPIMMPGASDLLSYLKEQGFAYRVVTADIPESAALTTEPFVAARLLDPSHVHGIARVGSKRNPRTWQTTATQYFPNARVVGVFEDTKANLDAALTAYNGARGFHVSNGTNQLHVHENLVHTSLRSLADYIIGGDLYAV